jgi:hypothetical protein
MDITKCVLRKFDQEKRSPSCLPSMLSRRRKLQNEILLIDRCSMSKVSNNDSPVLPIDSVENCLQMLKECHEVIVEQDLAKFVCCYCRCFLRMIDFVDDHIC